MALKPLPPRNKTDSEMRRYKADMEQFKSNPEAYGRIDNPQSMQHKLREASQRLTLGKRD